MRQERATQAALTGSGRNLFGQKILLSLACIIMVLLCTMRPKAETIQIQCGDNVYGTLSDTGCLTISGSGDMWNCTSGMESYFASYGNSIFTVVIGDGVTSIGDYAFAYENAYMVDSKVQSVSIGSGVKKIGSWAFAYCYNLFSIDIPGNVETISSRAFFESSLKTCTLHEGLKEIGENAFYDTPLSSIVIPEGLHAIRENAFADVYLKNVSIPSTIGVIEPGAFEDVSAVIYSNTVTIAPGAFGSGSVFTARKGSTADTYASNYKLKITYFECEPSVGLPLLTHEWGAGSVIDAGTCLSKGKMSYACVHCGATKIEETGFAEHTYGAWQVTSAATVFRAGMESCYCTVCGEEMTRELPKAEASIKLNKSSLTIYVNQSSKSVKVAYMGPGDSIELWKSTNNKVATVSQGGKITGRQAGTAFIRITLKSGVKAAVRVDVERISTKKLSISAKGATIKNKKVSVKKGKKFTLKPKVSPSNSTDEVTYSSSKRAVASVSKKGTVTARKKGTAKITVRSGSKKVVITVSVK